MRVENVKGSIIGNIVAEGFKIKGLLIPKDEVSRNGILYDWDSVVDKHKEFEGLTINYNHLTDDDKPPVGKITKTFIKEEADDEGPAGVYYEGDIDEDSEYANSIKKGYLNKVSLQVMADGQEEETDDDGNTYTRAYVKDPLEMSVVKIPGFKSTTMEVAMAEAFELKRNPALAREMKEVLEEAKAKVKAEGMTTATNIVVTKPLEDDDEEEKDDIDNDSNHEEFVRECLTLGETKLKELIEGEIKMKNTEKKLRAILEENAQMKKLLEGHQADDETKTEEVDKDDEKPVMTKGYEGVKKEEEDADTDEEDTVTEDAGLDKVVDILENLTSRVEHLEDDEYKKEMGDEDKDKEEGLHDDKDSSHDDAKKEMGDEDKDAKKEMGDEDKDAKKEDASPQAEQEPEQTPKVAADENPIDYADKQTKGAKDTNITKNESTDTEEDPAKEDTTEEEPEKEGNGDEEESDEDKDGEPTPPVVEKLNSYKIQKVKTKLPLKEAVRSLLYD